MYVCVCVCLSMYVGNFGLQSCVFHMQTDKQNATEPITTKMCTKSACACGQIYAHINTHTYTHACCSAFRSGFHVRTDDEGGDVVENYDAEKHKNLHTFMFLKRAEMLTVALPLGVLHALMALHIGKWVYVCARMLMHGHVMLCYRTRPASRNGILIIGIGYTYIHWV